MNRWGIPAPLEAEVRRRDRVCIYCGASFLRYPAPIGSQRAVATWEHIINDARLITRENIARCCGTCNSSKGTKTLSDWLETSYCKQRGITRSTIADVAQQSLMPGVRRDRNPEP